MVPTFFFLKKMGDQKKKDGLKNELRKFKIEFLRKLKEMCSGAKNITRLSPLGVPKKKDGRSMGNVPKFAHKIKMKKMGCPKKKGGETPIFLKLIFGAHLSPIPICNHPHLTTILKIRRKAVYKFQNFLAD